MDGNCISYHVDFVNKYRIKAAHQKLIIHTINLQRGDLSFEIEEKKFDREREILRLKFLMKEERKFKYRLILHKRIIDVLEKAMENPSFANKAYQENAIQSVLLEEDTNFRKLHFLMLHGTYSLAQEKHLLRVTNQSQPIEAMDSKEDLKQFVSWLFHNRQFYNSDELWVEYMLRLIDGLKCSRKKAIANVALKAMIWNIWGPKKAIKEKIKGMEKESEEIKRKLLSVKTEMKEVERGVKTIEIDICSLWRQMEAANQRKRSATREYIDELRKNYNDIL